MLLTNSAASAFAVSDAHRFPALALAFTLAFARVLGSFAIVLTFAAVDAVAMHLRLFRHYLGRQTGEQPRSGQGQRALAGHRLRVTSARRGARAVLPPGFA